MREDDYVIYENPYYKKIKGSYILLVSCGYCKTDIAKYQKLGRGGLLRMHLDRIIKSSIDLSKDPRALVCPNYNEQLAARTTLKRENKEVFRMIRSTFNTREIG